MRILVITGSPHKNGATALLAERFLRGAAEAGHTAARFDAAFRKVHPCIACERCHTTDCGCVFQDDMEELNPLLLAADAVVFVTPIYYFGMNAQIRTVIDRFYANNSALRTAKKTALLLAMADDTMESAAGAIATFRGMAGYLGWEIAGIVTGASCGSAEAMRETDYPRQAYELGKTI